MRQAILLPWIHLRSLTDLFCSHSFYPWDIPRVAFLYPYDCVDFSFIYSFCQIEILIAIRNFVALPALFLYRQQLEHSSHILWHTYANTNPQCHWDLLWLFWAWEPYCNTYVSVLFPFTLKDSNDSPFIDTILPEMFISTPSFYPDTFWTPHVIRAKVLIDHPENLCFWF